MLGVTEWWLKGRVILGYKVIFKDKRKEPLITTGYILDCGETFQFYLKNTPNDMIEINTKDIEKIQIIYDEVENK